MNKILVIDDLPENVFILKDRLEYEGHEILTAYDGESGYEKAVNELPDLILLDVMMPGIDGLQVCKKLTENELTKRIPIILVTAKIGADDIRIGLEAGAFDYIKKPYNRIELIARITSALKYSDAQKMLLASEKRDVYSATVVTANHKIRQPLTLMNLTSASIKRELKKDIISKETIISKLNYLEIAVKEINAVLKQLQNIKDPRFSEYANDIQMIDVENNEDEKSN